MANIKIINSNSGQRPFNSSKPQKEADMFSTGTTAGQKKRKNGIDTWSVTYLARERSSLLLGPLKAFLDKHGKIWYSLIPFDARCWISALNGIE